MLKFDFTNMMEDAVGAANGLTAGDRSSIAELAPKAHDVLGKWRKSEDALFYDVVFQDDLLEGIKAKADEVASRFDNVVVTAP